MRNFGAMRNFSAMRNFGAMRNFSHFLHHTNHLCLYRLSCSPSLYFPNVSTLALIRCSEEGVHTILKPTIFPNLKRIHYLSLHPGDPAIYKRFPKSVSWVFPTRPYHFYDCMVSAGLGKKDPTLISTYIASSKLINEQMEFDLHIPEYGILDGEVYRAQFGKNEVPFAIPEKITYNPRHFSLAHHPFQQYYQKKIDNDFFEQLITDCTF